jgi:hypothetical protein
MAKQSRASWPGAGARRYARNDEAREDSDRFQPRDTSDLSEPLFTGRRGRRKARTASKAATTVIAKFIKWPDRPDRHGERSEAIQSVLIRRWIASLRLR